MDRQDAVLSGADHAQERLCRTYWPLLYTYLRRHRYSPENAEDLVQGFFEHLIEAGHLGTFRPNQSWFRGFLLSCLRNYVATQHQSASRFKRGGGVIILSLDVPDVGNRYLLESFDGDTPEQALERQWVLAVIDRVLALLETEAAAVGKRALFSRLENSLFGCTSTTSYAELAERMGISLGGAKMAVHRLRERFRELVRQQILQAIGRAGDVEDELTHMAQVFSR